VGHARFVVHMHHRSSEVLAVRIPADQRVVIRAAALTEGKTLSAFVREAALERALEPSAPRRSQER
jgi:uncharacterized protein (DUF1778 family)